MLPCSRRQPLFLLRGYLCGVRRLSAGGLRSVVAATAEELGFTHCLERV